ncbi:MAG: SHOCT domain-containing protein [Archaeoglobus sp.]|nr:SHOCT domain-containing protein [Archaeoglobus sp.]
MNGYMGYMTMPWFGFTNFFGFGLIWWIVFLAIGYLVYQDANKKGMNGLLWFILVILPMVGIIFLIIYIVIRETSHPVKPESTKPIEILKERLARGDITEEEYRKLKAELEG